MNARSFRFSLVLFLASLAVVTTSALPGEPGAITAFVSPSQLVRLSTDGTAEMAQFRMMLNFRPSESPSPAESIYPGGITLALADGSVRLLQATNARLIADREGNLVEIQADMVDTGTSHSWTFQILPFIEQDNLYSCFLTDGQVRLEFVAVGHLLPIRRSR
jgi:hypothetical protein